MEINLGHRELETIIFSLEDCERNKEISHELGKSKSSQIRTHIANNEYLNDETVDLLLKDSSVEVLRAIVSRDYTPSRMKKEDLERLIEIGDTELLIIIAGKISEYVDEFGICKMDWLCEKLITQEDPVIRYMLAENDYTPDHFLGKLTHDEDINVAEKAMRALIDKDVDWIEDLS